MSLTFAAIPFEERGGAWQTRYWSPDGKPISANQMIEKLFGELPRFFKDEDELRRLWSKPDTRKALLQGLADLPTSAG